VDARHDRRTKPNALEHKVKKPTLADFGITDKTIALAEQEEAETRQRAALAAKLASRRRNRRWLVFWLLFLGVTLFVWTKWTHREAFAVAVCGMAAFAYVAVVDEMLGVSKWWKRRGERRAAVVARRNPVLIAKAQYEQALADYELAENRQKRDFWKQMEGLQFEHELARVLRAANYLATVTRGSGDDGVDIWAEKDGETIAIQCKRYGGAVGPDVVRELYGVILHLEADRGIVATTGYFTNGAISFVEGKPIELWTLEEILALQKETTDAA
jgi:HJR/Mrr/RecB family endonuclease